MEIIDFLITGPAGNRGGKYMINADFFIVFVGISVLAFWFYRNSTMVAIKEINYNSKSNPCDYWLPPRWMRKLFSLPKKQVRKYLIVRLYFACIHTLLSAVYSLMYIYLGESEFVAGILIMIQVCWILLDTVFFLVYWRIYKK